MPRRKSTSVNEKKLFTEFVDYEFTSDPVKASSEAARELVLHPIANALNSPVGTKPRVLARFLLREWRNRLYALRDAGWTYVQRPSNLRVMGNCLPETVRCASSSVVTCKSVICPWCHARKVTRIFDLLKFADLPAQAALLRGRQLFHIWLPTPDDADAGARPSSVTPASDREAVKTQLSTGAREASHQCALLKPVGIGGTWWLRSWEGPTERQPSGPSVLFCAPQVFGVTLVDRAVPLFRAWRGAAYAWREVNFRARLLRAVENSFAYPTWWMTGPAADVVAHLNARSGTVPGRPWGLFRKPQTQK